MNTQLPKGTLHNMQRKRENYTDVCIIGAGTSGQMAAVLLAEYGIDFRIVEKLHVRRSAGISECQ